MLPTLKFPAFTTEQRAILRHLHDSARNVHNWLVEAQGDVRSKINKAGEDVDKEINGMLDSLHDLFYDLNDILEMDDGLKDVTTSTTLVHLQPDDRRNLAAAVEAIRKLGSVPGLLSESDRRQPEAEEQAETEPGKGD